jgi:hypothetical protein
MNSLSYLHPRAPEITLQISPPDYPFSPIEIFDYGLWQDIKKRALKSYYTLS